MGNRVERIRRRIASGKYLTARKERIAQRRLIKALHGDPLCGCDSRRTRDAAEIIGICCGVAGVVAFIVALIASAFR